MSFTICRCLFNIAEAPCIPLPVTEGKNGTQRGEERKPKYEEIFAISPPGKKKSKEWEFVTRHATHLLKGTCHTDMCSP